jgi:hypothetical protein
MIEHGRSHGEVLDSDALYQQLITRIRSDLPSGELRKWRTGPGYSERFCRSFIAAQPEFKPVVSACSFQEKILRGSKEALIGSYNSRVGGIEGRGIGFEEFTDDKDRRQMRHSFIDFHGHHELLRLENQMLVLLLTAWFIADQYEFYFRAIVDPSRTGFDDLHVTVVSDKLSGDDEVRRESEAILRYLIDPEGERMPFTLARSAASDTFSGDLVADNLAGWLNATMKDPSGTAARYAQELTPTGVWNGWHCLQASASRLEASPATSRFTGAVNG